MALVASVTTPRNDAVALCAMTTVAASAKTATTPKHNTMRFMNNLFSGKFE
jgi:hypothetical protein